MSSTPKHYYMVTALMTYVRDDQPKQVHLNLVMELPRKAITAADIKTMERALQQQMLDRFQVPFEDIKYICFLNISHLANMKPEDFYQQPKMPNNVTMQ